MNSVIFQQDPSWEPASEILPFPKNMCPVAQQELLSG